VMARLMAGELTKQFGQQVIVDNRAGGNGIIAFEPLARSTPDGYTIGMATFPFIINPALFAKLPYDSIRDFQPLIHQNNSTFVLAVTPALPVRSAKELVDYARANPGKLLAGHVGYGPQFLAIELFKRMSGARIENVSYKAVQQAIADAVAAQVQVICDNAPSIMPHVRSERLRAIGVLTSKRSALLPDVPAISEVAIPGYEFHPSGGYLLPAGTPPRIVAQLNAAINKALKSEAVLEKFAAMGLTAVGGSPEAYADFIRAERAKWSEVIRTAGIKPQ
jgi:tripartite-type tricarboxylate transporter receptor subunit TctC